MMIVDAVAKLKSVEYERKTQHLFLYFIFFRLTERKAGSKMDDTIGLESWCTLCQLNLNFSFAFFCSFILIK